MKWRVKVSVRGVANKMTKGLFYALAIFLALLLLPFFLYLAGQLVLAIGKQYDYILFKATIVLLLSIYILIVRKIYFCYFEEDN